MYETVMYVTVLNYECTQMYIKCMYIHVHSYTFTNAYIYVHLLFYTINYILIKTRAAQETVLTCIKKVHKWTKNVNVDKCKVNQMLRNVFKCTHKMHPNVHDDECKRFIQM